MKKGFQSGFTLIEAVVYIALLGLILSGAVLVSYQLLDCSTNASSNTTVQDEGGFAVRKLQWALSGASAASASGNTLTISRYDGNTVTVRLSGTALEVKESAVGAAFVPLTTPNVTVQTFLAQTQGTSPVNVTATTTLKIAGSGTHPSLTFVLSKYLR